MAFDDKNIENIQQQMQEMQDNINQIFLQQKAMETVTGYSSSQAKSLFKGDIDYSLAPKGDATTIGSIKAKYEEAKKVEALNNQYKRTVDFTGHVGKNAKGDTILKNTAVVDYETVGSQGTDKFAATQLAMRYTDNSGNEKAFNRFMALPSSTIDFLMDIVDRAGKDAKGLKTLSEAEKAQLLWMRDFRAGTDANGNMTISAFHEDQKGNTTITKEDIENITKNIQMFSEKNLTKEGRSATYNNLVSSKVAAEDMLKALFGRSTNLTPKDLSKIMFMSHNGANFDNNLLYKQIAQVIGTDKSFQLKYLDTLTGARHAYSRGKDTTTGKYVYGHTASEMEDFAGISSDMQKTFLTENSDSLVKEVASRMMQGNMRGIVHTAIGDVIGEMGFSKPLVTKLMGMVDAEGSNKVTTSALELGQVYKAQRSYTRANEKEAMFDKDGNAQITEGAQDYLKHNNRIISKGRGYIPSDIKQVGVNEYSLKLTNADYRTESYITGNSPDEILDKVSGFLDLKNGMSQKDYANSGNSMAVAIKQLFTDSNFFKKFMQEGEKTKVSSAARKGAIQLLSQKGMQDNIVLKEIFQGLESSGLTDGQANLLLQRLGMQVGMLQGFDYSATDILKHIRLQNGRNDFNSMKTRFRALATSLEEMIGKENATTLREATNQLSYSRGDSGLYGLAEIFSSTILNSTGLKSFVPDTTGGNKDIEVIKKQIAETVATYKNHYSNDAVGSLLANAKDNGLLAKGLKGTALKSRLDTLGIKSKATEKASNFGIKENTLGDDLRSLEAMAKSKGANISFVPSKDERSLELRFSASSDLGSGNYASISIPIADAEGRIVHKGVEKADTLRFVTTYKNKILGFDVVSSAQQIVQNITRTISQDKGKDGRPTFMDNLNARDYGAVGSYLSWIEGLTFDSAASLQASATLRDLDDSAIAGMNKKELWAKLSRIDFSGLDWFIESQGLTEINAPSNYLSKTFSVDDVRNTLMNYIMQETQGLGESWLKENKNDPILNALQQKHLIGSGTTLTNFIQANLPQGTLEPQQEARFGAKNQINFGGARDYTAGVDLMSETKRAETQVQHTLKKIKPKVLDESRKQVLVSGHKNAINDYLNTADTYQYNILGITDELINATIESEVKAIEAARKAGTLEQTFGKNYQSYIDEIARYQQFAPSVHESGVLVTKEAMDTVDSYRPEKMRIEDDLLADENFAKFLERVGITADDLRNLEDGGSKVISNKDIENGLLWGKKNSKRNFIKHEGDVLNAIVRSEGKLYLDYNRFLGGNVGQKLLFDLTGWRTTANTIVSQQFMDAIGKKAGFDGRKVDVATQLDTMSKTSITDAIAQYNYIFDEYLKKDGANIKTLQEALKLGNENGSALSRYFTPVQAEDGTISIQSFANRTRDENRTLMDKDGKILFNSPEEAQVFLSSGIEELAKALGVSSPNAKGYDGGTYAMYRSGMGTANVYQWRRANGFDTYGNTREYGSLKVDPKSRYTVQRRINMAKTGSNDKNLEAYGKAWEAFGSQEDDSAFHRLQAEAQHMQKALQLTSGAMSPENPNEVFTLEWDSDLMQLHLSPDMGQRDGAHGHGYTQDAYNDTAYGALLKQLGGKYKYIKINTKDALHFPVSQYSAESFSSSSFYIPLMTAQMNNGEIDPRNFERGFSNVIKQFQNGSEADIQRALSGMYASMGNDILNKEGGMNQLLNKKVAMNAMSGVAKGFNIANEREILEGGSVLDYKDVIIGTERMREMLTISDDLWKEGTSKKGKEENQKLLQTAKDNLAYTYRNLQEQLGIKDIEDFGEITAENQSEIIQKILDMTDISKVGADGKLGRIAGTLLRWPLVNSMGQPIVNLVHDSNLPNVNTIIMNSGIAKLVAGDFDDDTLYAAFSLMSNKYSSYDDFKQAMSGHDVLANMQAVQTQILAHQMQANYFKDMGEQTGVTTNEEGKTIKQAKIEKTADYLYGGGKQDSMETMQVKRNFNKIGMFSNINTSVRETLDEIGMGAMAQGENVQEITRNMVAGEVINAFSEFFEQDVISAKKIAGRLDAMYKSGKVENTQQILDSVMNVYTAFSNSKYDNNDETGETQAKYWAQTIDKMAKSGLLGDYIGEENGLSQMTFSGKQLDRALSGLEAKGLTEAEINEALGITKGSYRQIVGEGKTQHVEYSIPLSAIPQLFAMADVKIGRMFGSNNNLMLRRYSHLPFGTQYDETNFGTLMRNAVSKEIVKAEYIHKNGLLDYKTTHYNKVTKEDKPLGGHLYKANGVESDYSITEAGNLLFGKSEDAFYKGMQHKGKIEEVWNRALLLKDDDSPQSLKLKEQFLQEYGSWLSDQSFQQEAQKYLTTKYKSSARGTAIHGIFEALEKDNFFDNKEIYNDDGKLNTEKFVEELIKHGSFQNLEKTYADMNATMSRMSLKGLFGNKDIQDAKDIATLYAQNRGQMKTDGDLALLEEFEMLMNIGSESDGLKLGGTADGITLKGVTDYKIKKGGGRAIGLLESWQLNAAWRNKVSQMQSDLEQANIHRVADMDVNGDWFKQIEEVAKNGQGSELLSKLKDKGLMNEYKQMLSSFLRGETPLLTIKQLVKGQKGGWSLLTHYFDVMDDETFNALSKVLGDAKKQFNNKDWWIKQQVEALGKFTEFNTKRLGKSKGVNLEGKAVNPYDVDDALYKIENLKDPKQREEFFKYYKSLDNRKRGQFVTQEKVMNMFGLTHETDKDKLKPIRDAFRKFLDKEMDITQLTSNERAILSSYAMEGMEDNFNVDKVVERIAHAAANEFYNTKEVFSEKGETSFLWNKSYESIKKVSSKTTDTIEETVDDNFREKLFFTDKDGNNILKETKMGYELPYGNNKKLTIHTNKNTVDLSELTNILTDEKHIEHPEVMTALKDLTSILHTHNGGRFLPTVDDLSTFGILGKNIESLQEAKIFEEDKNWLTTIDLSKFRAVKDGKIIWLDEQWKEFVKIFEGEEPSKEAIEEAKKKGLLRQEDDAQIISHMSSMFKEEVAPLQYHNIASALANLGKSDIADIYKLTTEEMLTNPELVEFGDYAKNYDKGLAKSFSNLQKNEQKISNLTKKKETTEKKLNEAKNRAEKNKINIKETNSRIGDLKALRDMIKELDTIMTKGNSKSIKKNLDPINALLSELGLGDYQFKFSDKRITMSDIRPQIENLTGENGVINSTITTLETNLTEAQTNSETVKKLTDKLAKQDKQLGELTQAQNDGVDAFNKKIKEGQNAKAYSNKRQEAIQAMQKAINYSEGKDTSSEAKEAYDNLYGSKKEKKDSLRQQVEQAAHDAGIDVDKNFIKGIRQEAKAKNRIDETKTNKLLQETTSQFNALQQMMAQNAPTQFLNSMAAGLEKNLKLLGGKDGIQGGIEAVVGDMSDTHKVQMLQNIDQQFQGSMAQLRNIQLAKANAEAQLTDERRVLFGDNKGTYRTPKEYITNPYMSKMMSMKLNQLSTQEAMVQADVAQQIQSVKGTPMEQQMLEQQKFNEQIVETNKQIQETQRYATQGASGLQKFGQSFKGMLNSAFQYGVVYRGAQAVIQQIFTIIGAVKQFDTMATQIRMINNTSKDTATGMIKGYRDVADELGTLTSSITQAGITFLRQGRNIADTNQLIKDSSMLAKVGMMEEAQSAELLTATLNGFQLEAKDATDVIDLVSYTDTIAATSTQELMTAFQYVASSANNAGIDIEHLNSMITTTSEATRLTASTIGQAFKTIVSRIQQVKAGSLTDAESGEDISNVDKVLKQHGIEVYSSTGGLATGQDILASVGENWKTMSKAQQREVTEALGGTRQGNIVMSLMENWDRNQEILADTEVNASGSASKKQEIYNESIDASIARLQNALQDIFSEDGWAKDTYKWVVDLLTAFADFGEVIIPLVTLFLLLKNGATGLNTVYNMQIGLYNKLTGTLKLLTNAEEYRLQQAQKGLVNGNVSTVSGGGLSAIKDPVTGTIGDPMESAKVAQTVAFQNTENLKKQMIAGGLHKYDNVYGEGAQSTWQRWQEAELGLQKAAVSQSGVSSSAVQKVENLVGEQVVANKISAEQGSQIMAGASAIAQRGVNTDAFNRIFNESFTTSDGQLITDKNFDYAGKTAELQKETSGFLKDHPEMKPKVEQSTDAFVSLNTVIKQVIESLNIFNAKLNNKEYVPTTNSEGQPEVKKMSKDIGGDLKKVRDEKASLQNELNNDVRNARNKEIGLRQKEIDKRLSENETLNKKDEEALSKLKSKRNRKTPQERTNKERLEQQIKARKEENQKLSEEKLKNEEEVKNNSKQLKEDKDYQNKKGKLKSLKQQEKQLKNDLKTKEQNRDYLSDDDKDLERFKFEDAKNKAKVTAQSELDRANQEVKQARGKFNDLKAQEKLGELPKNSKELTQANEELIKSLDKQRVAQENLNKVTQAETQSELDNASANLRDAETELQNANANQSRMLGTIKGATGFGANNTILQAAQNGSVKAQAAVTGAGMLGFMGTSMGATGLLQKAGVSDSIASLGGMVGGSVVSTISATNPLLGAGIGVALAGINAIMDYQEKKAEKIREEFQKAEESVNTMSKDLREIEEEEFQSEFEKLSKGVDEQGRNISLSDIEYQTYQDYVSKLTEGREQLIEGYDEEGNALINRNNIMSESMKLLEEEIRLKREEAYADKEAIKTRLEDNIDNFKKKEGSTGVVVSTIDGTAGYIDINKVQSEETKEMMLDMAQKEMKDKGLPTDYNEVAKNKTYVDENGKTVVNEEAYEQSRQMSDILEKYGLTVGKYNNNGEYAIDFIYQDGKGDWDKFWNAYTSLPKVEGEYKKLKQEYERIPNTVYQQYASTLQEYTNLTDEQQSTVSEYIKTQDITNVDAIDSIKDNIDTFVSGINGAFGEAFTTYVKTAKFGSGEQRREAKKLLAIEAKEALGDEDALKYLKQVGYVTENATLDQIINGNENALRSKAESELINKINNDKTFTNETIKTNFISSLDNLSESTIEQLYEHYDSLLLSSATGLDDLNKTLSEFVTHTEAASKAIDTSFIKKTTEGISALIEAGKEYNTNLATINANGDKIKVFTPKMMEATQAFAQEFGLNDRQFKQAFMNSQTKAYELGPQNMQRAILMGITNKLDDKTLDLETLMTLDNNMRASGISGVKEAGYEEFIRQKIAAGTLQYDRGSQGFNYDNLYGQERDMAIQATEYIKSLGTEKLQKFINSIPNEAESMEGVFAFFDGFSENYKDMPDVTERLNDFKTKITETTKDLGGLVGALSKIKNSALFDLNNLGTLNSMLTGGMSGISILSYVNEMTEDAFVGANPDEVTALVLQGATEKYRELDSEIQNQTIQMNEYATSGTNAELREKEYSSYKAGKAVDDLKAQMRVDDLQLDKLQAGFDNLAKSIENLGNAMNNLDSNDFVGKFDLINQQLGYSNEYMTELDTSTGDLAQKFAEATTYAEMNAIYEQMAKNEEAYSAQLQKQVDLRKQQNSLIVEAFNSGIENQQKIAEREMSILQMQRNNIRPEKRNYYNVDKLMTSALMMPNATKNNVEKARTEAEKILAIQNDSQDRMLEYKKIVLDKMLEESKANNERELQHLQDTYNEALQTYQTACQNMSESLNKGINDTLIKQKEALDEIIAKMQTIANMGKLDNHELGGTVAYNKETGEYSLTNKGKKEVETLTQTINPDTNKNYSYDEAVKKVVNQAFDSGVSSGEAAYTEADKTNMGRIATDTITQNKKATDNWAKKKSIKEENIIFDPETGKPIGSQAGNIIYAIPKGAKKDDITQRHKVTGYKTTNDGSQTPWFEGKVQGDKYDYYEVSPNMDATSRKAISNGPISVAENGVPEYVHFKDGTGAIFDKPTVLDGSKVDFVSNASEAFQGKKNGMPVEPYLNGGNETPLSSSTNTQKISEEVKDTSEEVKEKVEENNESIVINVEETNTDIFDKTKKHNEDVKTNTEETNKKVFDNTKVSNAERYKDINDTNWAVKSNTKKSLDETLLLFQEFFDNVQNTVPTFDMFGDGEGEWTYKSGININAFRKTKDNHDFDAYIQEASELTGIPFGMIKTIMSIESDFKPDAYNDTYGASGLMQIIPMTWNEIYNNLTKKYHRDENLNMKNDPFDPRSNILAGAIYLEDLKARYDGNWDKAIKEYSGGSSTYWNLMKKIGYNGSGGGFHSVLSYPITSAYNHNRSTHKHQGIDIGYPMGSPLYNNKPLKITAVGYEPGYGNYIYATDGNYEYRFAHLDSQTVRTGQTIGVKTLMGYTGNSGRSTGPHLHYEMRKNGKSINPTNKYVFYDKGTGETNKKDLSSFGIMSEKRGEYKVDKKTGEWIYEPEETVVDTSKYDVINSQDSQMIRSRKYDEGTLDESKVELTKDNVTILSTEDEDLKKILEKLTYQPLFVTEQFKTYLRTEQKIRNQEQGIMQDAMNSTVRDAIVTFRQIEDRRIKVLDEQTIATTQRQIEDYERKRQILVDYFNDNEELLKDTTSDEYTQWYDAYNNANKAIEDANTQLQELVQQRIDSIADDVAYAMSQIVRTQSEITKAMNQVESTMNNMRGSQTYNKMSLSVDSFLLSTQAYDNIVSKKTNYQTMVEGQLQDVYSNLLKVGIKDIDGTLKDMLTLSNYANADYSLNTKVSQDLNTLLSNEYENHNVDFEARHNIDTALGTVEKLLENLQTVESEKETLDQNRYSKLWSIVEATNAYYEDEKKQRYSIYQAIIQNNEWIKQMVQLQGELLKDTDTIGKSSNMVSQYNQNLELIQDYERKYNELSIDVKRTRKQLSLIEDYDADKWFDAQGNIIEKYYNADKAKIEEAAMEAVDTDPEKAAELTGILSKMETLEGLYQEFAQHFVDYGNKIKETISYQKELLNYEKELLKTFQDELVSDFKKNTASNEMSIEFLSKIERTLGTFDRDSKITSINSQLRINSNERQNLLSQRGVLQESTAILTDQINQITDKIDVSSLFTATGEQMTYNYNEAQRLLTNLKETGAIKDEQYNNIVSNIDQIGENLKEEVSLNNNIISNYEQENELLDKKIELEQESYDWQIKKMESLLELKEKQFDIENKIFDLRQNLDKELRSAKQSMQWLTKSERLKIFNEEDYTKLYQSIDKMEQQSQNYYNEYYNQIMNLTEDTLYQQEYITAEYQRRMELVEAEYNLTEKRVDLEKQQLKLKNTLAEKNTRMYINGEWVQVANTEDVISESEALSDAQAEYEKAEQERLQQLESNRMNEYIDGLKEIQAALENSTKSTNQNEQQLIDELAKLTTVLLGGELNNGSLATLVDSLNVNINKFVQDSNKLINQDLITSIKELHTIINGLETNIQEYNELLEANIEVTNAQMSELHSGTKENYRTFFSIMNSFGTTIHNAIDKLINYLSYDGLVYNAVNSTVWYKDLYDTATTDDQRNDYHSNARLIRDNLHRMGQTDIANFLLVANADEVRKFQVGYKEAGPEGVQTLIKSILASSEDGNAKSMSQRAYETIIEKTLGVLSLKEEWNNTTDVETQSKLSQEAEELRQEIGYLGQENGLEIVASSIIKQLNQYNSTELQDFSSMIKKLQDYTIDNQSQMSAWAATVQKENEELMSNNQTNLAVETNIIQQDWLNAQQNKLNVEDFLLGVNDYKTIIDEEGKLLIQDKDNQLIFEGSINNLDTILTNIPQENADLMKELWNSVINAINQKISQIETNLSESQNTFSGVSYSASVIANMTPEQRSAAWYGASNDSKKALNEANKSYYATQGKTYNAASGTYEVSKKANGGITNAALELANIDENGKELYIPSGRLKMMEYGDQVIPHNLSENLLKWGALNPALLQSSNPEIQTSTTNKKELNVQIDNVNLENVTNGENFIPELNRYLRRTTTLDR